MFNEWKRQSRRAPFHRAVAPTSLALAGLLLAGCGSTVKIPGTQLEVPVPQFPGRPGHTGPQTVGVGVKDPDLRRLFAKGTLTGDELYERMKQMRLEMRAKRSARAWAVATAVADKAMNNLGNANLTELALSTAVTAVKETVKAHTMSVAYQALDEHMTVLLGEDRRAVLSAETVTLPSSEKMNDAQARRAVNLALLVVAARVTDQILSKADEDFKSLAVDYKSLLDQREKASELLFTVVDKRRAAKRGSDATGAQRIEQSMKTTLTDQDIAYIDTTLNTMTLREFATDMAAQNLALKFLRSQDPAAFKDYTQKKVDVVRRTDAYLRTIAGVAAFGSASAVFASTLSDLYHEKRLDIIAEFTPLLTEFAYKAGPLAAKSAQVAAAGVAFPSTLFSPKMFTVAPAGSAPTAGNASDVFEAIKTNGATEAFNAALFRSDSMGWLNRVRLCDAPESGRMLDVAVPTDSRTSFATSYFGPAAKDIATEYSFVNSFTDPQFGERERQLADDLLGADLRERASSIKMPLSVVQKTVIANYGQWSNTHLMRLIFANREGGAAYATMDLGRLAVRPVPTPEAVYAYERLVDACADSADPKPRAQKPPPDGKGASRGAAKPAAKGTTSSTTTTPAKKP